MAVLFSGATSFLIRFIQQQEKETDTEYSGSDLFLTMLRIGEALEKQKKPYAGYEITTYFDHYLFKHSAFDDMIKIIKEIQDDELRCSVINGLENRLPYDVGNAAVNLREKAQKDKDGVQRIADEAERFLNYLASESSACGNIPKPYALKVEKKGNGRDTIPMWKVNLRQFIWNSYILAGSSADAEKKLTLWIESCRELKNHSQKVRALNEVAMDIYIYKSYADYNLAVSLLNESEQIARLIEDPNYRDPELEAISRMRKFIIP